MKPIIGSSAGGAGPKTNWRTLYREALVLIEFVMSRLDASGALVNFAQRCAEFNFPQLATLPGPGP
jgi:hypothetical protein